MNLPANAAAGFANSAATDNATSVTAVPTTLLQVSGYNPSGKTIFIKLYDKATAPASTDTPRKRIPVAPGVSFVLDLNMYFITGLGYRIVTDAADNGTTAIAVGDIQAFNLDYR